jgi:hypothetical protein
MEGTGIDRGGYASDGSEEEYGPAPKRQRKHKFKTFKQRVNNVSEIRAILMFSNGKFIIKCLHALQFGSTPFDLL